MNNPGKYDKECTMVRERTKAQAVLLVVMHGERGSGFSVQAPKDMIDTIPDVLEFMAQEIRKGSAQ